MSFDKQYENRKDIRKPYRKAKRFDKSCRNHGSCSYCLDNRLHSYRKKLTIAEEQMIEDYRCLICGSVIDLELVNGNYYCANCI